MAILVQAVEELDYRLPGMASDISEAYNGNFRAGFARQTYTCNFVSAEVNAASRWTDPKSDLWASFRFYMNVGYQAVWEELFTFHNVNGDVITVAHDTQNYTLAFFLGGVTGTLLTSGGNLPQYAQRLDVHLRATVNGVLEVYRSGVLELRYTGDFSAFGATNKVKVWNPNKTIFAIENFFVADAATITYDLVVLAPSGAGDAPASPMTGAYTDIDEVFMDVADVVSSTAAGQGFRAALNNLPASITSLVPISIQMTAMKSSGLNGGPTMTKIGVRTNGTDSLSAPQQLTHEWSFTTHVIGSTNPVTGLPWTRAEIEALQYAEESSS